ncbi:MAG TPA: histidinol-phosphate transaminase [Symbiobacteriaceae bacterium]|nr:histidinol-phosphate transaminase [Symbiobacteriaceae bacterium]
MLTLRPAVKAMKPYVPGKPVADVQRELGITDLTKLNQNENPLGPSPKALEAASKALREAHTYPEGSSRALRQRLGAMWDLPEDWFIVGNGSDEVFRLLAETYLEPGDVAVVPTPSFAGYPLVIELMGARTVRVPLAANGAMDLDGMAETAANLSAKMVFLCRPNNPTGAVFAQDLFPAFMAQVPKSTLVILDEAYVEFDETEFDSRGLLLQYPNLVVTRTFSKIYGMAGFRLGYGVMRPEIIAPFYTVRDPFSVNNLASAAGLAALDDEEHLEKTKALTREGKAFLYQLFDELGVGYTPTQANFVLFDVGRSAAEVFDAMMRRGVLVRPCGSFGLPTCLRVTIGTPDENQRFASVLEAVLGEE